MAQSLDCVSSSLKVYTATCIFTNFSPHPNPNAHSSPKFDPNSNPALS